MNGKLTKILVLEDSADDGNTLADAIHRDASFDFELTFSDDGDQAIEEVTRYRYDCFVVDYNLPGHSGAALVKRLRSSNQSLTVVMINGDDSERQAVEALQSGAQEYVSKADLRRCNFAKLISSAIARKTSELQLLKQATQDPLTGAANRFALIRELDRAIARSTRNHHPFALISVDLNQFREISAHHGYGIGEKILIQVARRIGTSLRDCDSLARLSEHCFVILLEGLPRQCREQCESISQRLARIIEEIKIPGAGSHLAIGASLAIAVYPTSATTKEGLFAHLQKQNPTMDAVPELSEQAQPEPLNQTAHAVKQP